MQMQMAGHRTAPYALQWLALLVNCPDVGLHASRAAAALQLYPSMMHRRRLLLFIHQASEAGCVQRQVDW